MSPLFDMDKYEAKPEHDERVVYHSASFPTLRPFQATAHDKLRDGVRQGHCAQMIMAPTGSGKTILAMNIIQEGLIRGKRCMFVCDRKTLINQTSEVADVLGLSAHGVIAASHWRTNLRLPFQIASVQTLARRNWPEMDIVVFDEAHTLYSSSTAYIKAVAEANKLKDKKDWTYCIGLSATPFAPGLGQIYSNLINAATMAELTESGILVPMRIFSCTKVNMEGAATAGGEWTDKAAETRGMDIIGDVVTEWIKHASTRKTIVFGATIAHCEEMAKQFQEAGYKSAVFCATTTDEERKVILKDFDGPQCELRVLISVEALAKGFDVQDVECVCDVRPLRKSLSTAIQMWGRGLRSSPLTGKTDCFLLDFSGNIIRFADDFSDVFFHGLDALDQGEKLDKAIRRDEDKEPAKCPKCGFVPCGKKCIACGFERKPAVSTVEVLPGLMQEVTLGGKKLADDCRHLYEQICTYTRSIGNPDTAKQRAWYLFAEMAGRQLPRGWDFNSTPNVPLTKNVSNRITALKKAFRKSQNG